MHKTVFNNIHLYNNKLLIIDNIQHKSQQLLRYTLYNQYNYYSSTSLYTTTSITMKSALARVFSNTDISKSQQQQQDNISNNSTMNNNSPQHSPLSSSYKDNTSASYNNTNNGNGSNSPRHYSQSQHQRTYSTNNNNSTGINMNTNSPRGTNSPAMTPQERQIHKSNSNRALQSNGTNSPGRRSSIANDRDRDIYNNSQQVSTTQSSQSQSQLTPKNQSSQQQPLSQYSSQSSQYEVSATGFHPAARIAPLVEPTVWHFFTPLAQQTNAVNLGQGFPGWYVIVIKYCYST